MKVLLMHTLFVPKNYELKTFATINDSKHHGVGVQRPSLRAQF